MILLSDLRVEVLRCLDYSTAVLLLCVCGVPGTSLYIERAVFSLSIPSAASRLSSLEQLHRGIVFDIVNRGYGCSHVKG